jgi:hypothetical protein
MVARVNPTAGSKLYIGPVYSASVDTVTEFAALSYTIVSGVSTIGDAGDTSEVIRFPVLDENRVRKTKGVKDGGSLSCVMAFDSSDTGQTNLITAYGSSQAYAFKIEGNDKLTTSGTNSLTMFYGKVTSNAKNFGGTGDTVRRTVNIEVDSDIYTKAAT